MKLLPLSYVLSLVLVGLAPLAAQDVVDTSKIGPQVGTAVPAFSGPDQNGTIRTLASVAGPKGTMLVFFRSADW